LEGADPVKKPFLVALCLACAVPAMAPAGQLTKGKLTIDSYSDSPSPNFRGSIKSYRHRPGADQLIGKTKSTPGAANTYTWDIELPEAPKLGAYTGRSPVERGCEMLKSNTYTLD
jgi:hypothetical protein